MIDNAQDYDGKVVSYAGEVVGEVMPRGDFAWANISDGQNAIGVWLPMALARNIVYSGSYQAVGDRIEVTGIFHRACPEHGGDLDIHAEAFSVTARGRALCQPVNSGKKNTALVLGGVLCLVLILRKFWPRQRMK